MDDILKRLSSSESLKYYENKEYREEINLKYKKIYVDLSNRRHVSDTSSLKFVHTLNLSNCKNVEIL